MMISPEFKPRQFYFFIFMDVEDFSLMKKTNNTFDDELKAKR